MKQQCQHNDPSVFSKRDTKAFAKMLTLRERKRAVQAKIEKPSKKDDLYILGIDRQKLGRQITQLTNSLKPKEVTT